MWATGLFLLPAFHDHSRLRSRVILLFHIAAETSSRPELTQRRLDGARTMTGNCVSSKETLNRNSSSRAESQESRASESICPEKSGGRLRKRRDEARLLIPGYQSTRLIDGCRSLLIFIQQQTFCRGC